MALDLNPPQEQLNNLLEHYQTGRLVEAENLAISITQEFPKHPFSWIVLGAVLKQSGRYSEALSANQKAVILSPQDPAAHNNLGNTLKELRKLEQAEASYGQAIILKPDFAEAHNNLGITLKELGKLEEAEASCRQAIVLKPDFAEAYNNLGNTFKELGKLEEAEASCRQAIVLKPDFAEAHFDLGIILQKQGRFENAISSYTQASIIDPNNPTFYSKRGLTPSLIAIKPLSDRDDLMKSISDGDWESSEILLKEVFFENPHFISIHVEEFTRHWCDLCQGLVNQGAIKNLIQILIKLFVMVERNRDVNNLIQFFFNNYDIDIALKQVESKDRILIKVIYCQYLFIKEDFLKAEFLAIESIQNAASIIKVAATEDIGWLIVRRSLELCRRKDASGRALKHLITNLEN